MFQPGPIYLLNFRKHPSSSWKTGITLSDDLCPLTLAACGKYLYVQLLESPNSGALVSGQNESGQITRFKSFGHAAMLYGG